ncbi:porin family protein [Flavobacterium sp.]|jgi:opacity protein-like surface antigen|uniref:porin family protein n=1 Tax=Flavobacterium sp. TaxID=239 RepID=UPI002A7EDBE4|nr:porin family protein [Flavobacterium sp.]
MKYFSLIILFVFSVISVNAQDVDAKMTAKPKFGAKASLNLANILGDDAGDANTLVGYSVGFFTEIALTETFSIQPEILYSAQGSKSHLFYGGYNFDVTMKLNYINVPVMFKYKAADKFSLEAGPYIGFLTSAKLKLKNSSLGSETEDIKDLIKSTDLGFALGMNYDFTDSIFTNIRYSGGLVEIGNTDSDNNIKNSNLQIGLGIRF